MVHIHYLIEKLLEEKTLSKCLQPVFSKNAEKQTKNLRYGAKKSQESRKRRNLKHQGDGDV